MHCPMSHFQLPSLRGMVPNRWDVVLLPLVIAGSCRWWPTSATCSTNARAATAPKSGFLRELEDSLTEDDAERVLAVAIDWGRYAEVFAYDTARERFSAE